MTRSVSTIPAQMPHHGEAHGISHIIALHGLGASVSDLKPVASTMHLPHVHWHFVAAPTRPVTINSGVLMPAWFDICGFKETSPVDLDGIHSSSKLIVTHLQELIDHQGVAPKNIALLGFSQGGVIALHTGLTVPWKLGAIIGLSTWLPAKESLSSAAVNHDIPIWLGHGIHDDVVPFSAAEHAKQALQALGVRKLTLTRWQMGHSIHHEEMGVLKDWILAL